MLKFIDRKVDNMLYRYLFFIENENIRVFDYESKEFLSNKGENIFKYDETFWEWWIDSASYNTETGQADFCIIYDKEDKLILNHKLRKSEKTIWQKKTLEKVLFEYMQFSNMEININNGQEILLIENKPTRLFNYIEKKKFNAFIYNYKVEVENLIDESEKEESAIARWYREKMRREQTR